VAVAKTSKANTKKTQTSRKGSAAAKKAATKKSADKSSKSDKTVTVDRRSAQDRRTTPDRRKKRAPVAVERRKIERRAKVSRRRQIDPTTCERDYSSEEIEFMNALDEYKRTSGRMFPTCSEILEVIRKLGYQKAPVGSQTEPAPPETAAEPARPASVDLEVGAEHELPV
jgi:hypothetical protein